MADAAPAFQTFAELQEAHEQLLSQVDGDGGGDGDGEGSKPLGDSDAPPGSADAERHRLIGMIDAIRAFMRRGAEAGAYLDEPKERRAGQALLDYWASQCYAHQLDVPRPLLAPHDPALLPTLADDACTYVGLDAFGEADARHFFGRDDQVAGLVERLNDGRLVVVTGASGSGKSSLVLAGLLPALKRGQVPGSSQWRYLPTIVPGAAPLLNLAMALAPAALAGAEREAWAAAEVASLRNDARHAVQLLGADARPALLVVDQFEEALTLRTEQTSADYVAFVANLRGLVDVAQPPHRLVLTMRKDVEPQLAREYPDLNRIYGAAAFPVYSMESTRLREAIEKPAAQAGLKFQDGLVDELIKSVVGEDASLPLLQFSLMALWERRKGNLVTHEAYREVGSPRHAMAEAARRLYDELPRYQQLAAQKVFVALSRQGEGATVFRNRATRRVLHGVAEANNVDAVLAKFEAARLVRVTRANADPLDDVAEVAHESLLRNWDLLDRLFMEQRAERERHAFLHKQAEKWREGGFDQAFLLSGLALQQAKDEFAGDGVAALEREFLTASQAAEDARLRSLAEEEERRFAVESGRREVAERRAEVEALAGAEARRMADEWKRANKRIALRLNLTLIATIAAVGLAIWAAVSYDRARRAAAATETDLYALNAKALAESDSELSILLADAVVERNPSMTSRMAAVVIDAMQFRRAANRLSAADVHEADALALDPAGGRLLVANVNGIGEWSLRPSGATAARSLAWDGRPQEVHLVGYSPDGRLVAAATELGVSIWNGDATTATRLAGGEPVERFSFSADSRLLGGISSDGKTVSVWSLPDGERLLSYRPKDESGEGGIFSVIFSAASDKLIAVKAPDAKTTQMRLFVNAIHGRRIDPEPTTTLMQACPGFDFSYAAGGNKIGLSLNAKVCSFDVRRLAEGEAATSATPAPESGGVTDIAISPDGRFVVRLIGRINEAQVVNLTTGEVSRLQGAFDLPQSSSYEASLAISASGERLAIKARDGSIRIFELGTSSGSQVTSRWLSEDEKLVVVPASDGLHDFLELRGDLPSGRQLLRRLDPEGRYKGLHDFALGADGRELIARASPAGDDKGQVLLAFDIASDAPPREHRVDEIRSTDHDLTLVREGDEWRLYVGVADEPVFRMPAPPADAGRPRGARFDSLQLGNARLFAVQTYAAGQAKVELMAVEGRATKVLRSIERATAGRVDIAFQGEGRAFLVSDAAGTGTEVWDPASAASAPAFVLPDVLPRYVYAGRDRSLVIVHAPGKPWQVRSLAAGGGLVDTVPDNYRVDASSGYVWASRANRRGIQVRKVGDMNAPWLDIPGEDARPEFSRGGDVVAVKVARENSLRIYKLPEVTLLFEADMAAFEGSRLSEKGKYILYGDGRLIEADAARVVKSARERIKRDIDDNDRCHALGDAGACARLGAAAPPPR